MRLTTRGPARSLPGAGIGIMLLSALLWIGCGGEKEAPQEETPTTEESSADPVALGRESYVRFCASCHGPEAKGNGPVADALMTQPADLTRLASGNHGVFPTDSVYAYIDGRQYVQAHGTREMPVWGNIWSEQEGQPIREEEVDQRIKELVEFLRTLQDTTAVS